MHMNISGKTYNIARMYFRGYSVPTLCKKTILENLPNWVTFCLAVLCVTIISMTPELLKVWLWLLIKGICSGYKEHAYVHELFCEVQFQGDTCPGHSETQRCTISASVETTCNSILGQGNKQVVCWTKVKTSPIRLQYSSMQCFFWTSVEGKKRNMKFFSLVLKTSFWARRFQNVALYNKLQHTSGIIARDRTRLTPSIAWFRKSKDSHV